MPNQWITALTIIGPPALAFVGKFALANREPARLKRLKRHSAMYQDLPDGAQPAMERLMVLEVEKYAQVMSDRLDRRLDSGTVAAMIVIGVGVGGVIALGFWLAGLWGPWVHFLSGTAALFGILLMIAGSGQLWKKAAPSHTPSGSAGTN